MPTYDPQNAITKERSAARGPPGDSLIKEEKTSGAQNVKTNLKASSL